MSEPCQSNFGLFQGARSACTLLATACKLDKRGFFPFEKHCCDCACKGKKLSPCPLLSNFRSYNRVCPAYSTYLTDTVYRLVKAGLISKEYAERFSQISAWAEVSTTVCDLYNVHTLSAQDRRPPSAPPPTPQQKDTLPRSTFVCTLLIVGEAVITNDLQALKQRLRVNEASSNKRQISPNL